MNTIQLWGVFVVDAIVLGMCERIQTGIQPIVELRLGFLTFITRRTLPARGGQKLQYVRMRKYVANYGKAPDSLKQQPPAVVLPARHSRHVQKIL